MLGLLEKIVEIPIVATTRDDGTNLTVGLPMSPDDTEKEDNNDA